MFTKSILRLVVILCAVIFIVPLFSVYASASSGTSTEGWVRPSGTLYADFLHKLGLFHGTNKGFELEKKFNRDEAAVMLVRLLGAEDEALAGEYVIPFNDVDDWARPYVGWLLERKLTLGISATEFGSKSAITSQQYITFLVRCLGYSEALGDFTYNDVFDFTLEKGLFKNNHIVNNFRHYRPDFIRFDSTELTFYALMWRIKDSEKTLADTLMANGVFSEDKFYEGLWAFVQTYGVNGDGKLVRKYSSDIELPWLGVSKESYYETGWDWDEYIIAFADSGSRNPYAVDKITLEKKSKLSDYQISLMDLRLHNGLLYFYEYISTESPITSIVLKTYNYEKDEVKELLRCDNPITYDSFGNDRFIVVSKVDGKFEYNVVDLSTGTIVNCISEEAEQISAQYFARHYDEETKNYLSSLFIELVLTDEVRCYVYDAEILRDSISMPKKSNNDNKITIFEINNDDRTQCVAYSNNTFIEIGEDKKMTQLSDFDKSVASAFVLDDRSIYVLTCEEYYGLELGVISADGGYVVLAPESIIKNLGVTSITNVSANGSVMFVSESGVGMGHMDIITYTYNSETKKVNVTSFVPGRGEFYTEESIQKLLEEEQKKLDELQK